MASRVTTSDCYTEIILLLSTCDRTSYQSVHFINPLLATLTKLTSPYSCDGGLVPLFMHGRQTRNLTRLYVHTCPLTSADSHVGEQKLFPSCRELQVHRIYECIWICVTYTLFG
jgi:hypothetical protein